MLQPLVGTCGRKELAYPTVGHKKSVSHSLESCQSCRAWVCVCGVGGARARSPAASWLPCWASWEESGASLRPGETMEVSSLELGALRTWPQPLGNSHPSSKNPALTLPQGPAIHSFIQLSAGAPLHESTCL